MAGCACAYARSWLKSIEEEESSLPIHTTPTGWVLETGSIGYALGLNSAGLLVHTYGARACRADLGILRQLGSGRKLPVTRAVQANPRLIYQGSGRAC